MKVSGIKGSLMEEDNFISKMAAIMKEVLNMVKLKVLTEFLSILMDLSNEDKLKIQSFMGMEF